MSIQEFVKPELLILVPFLYVLGAIMKNLEFVHDRFIPLLLGLFGIVLSTLYIFGTMTIDGVQQGCMAAFTAITQGIICAGVAVYTNQIKKQADKKE